MISEQGRTIPAGSRTGGPDGVRVRVEFRSARSRFLPDPENLEGREMMTGGVAPTLPDVAMISATTLDSRGVTVDYRVENAPLAQPLTFGVYRSAGTTLDATDSSVGRATIAPGQLDSAGQPALAVGEHALTLPLAGGLPIDPEQPNVVVVADPDRLIAETTTADNTASFHKYVIGVITHGGKQPSGWKQGPPWEKMMAADLTAQGYDTVIPYNWVSQSNHPGAAAKQGPMVAQMVVQAAAALPAGSPADVHFIGHSEGAVVNSEALKTLNAVGWPRNLQAGYIKVTMLDPHAANSALKGQQYSVSGGLLGGIARYVIDDFQSKAKDPLPVVTYNVQSAEVFYQHTPVSKAQSNNGIYNLWGQVPVRGAATYYNLTAPGLSHSGHFGVQDWYRLNVVPTLGTGGTWVDAVGLTASRVATPAGARPTAVSYAGHAAPGATVKILAAPEFMRGMRPLATTRAGADGSWSLTTHALRDGRYRAVAVSTVPAADTGRPEYFKPTAWLGSLTVTGRGVSG